jgi:hypothetical protein
LEDKIKTKEKELKELSEKEMLDSRGRLGNQLFNEKKLMELMENEKKLYMEIEQLKAERD